MGTTSSTFAVDAFPWTLVSTATASNVTSCSSVPLLGGVGILNPSGYVKRTYQTLPTHDIIYFRLRFYVIDNWQSSDAFVIQFDSKSVSGGTPGSQKSGFLTDYCGSSSYNDLRYYTLVGKVLHSGSSLDLKVVSSLSSAPSVASFGVREVSLQFVNKTSSDSESVCSDISDSGYNSISMSNACSCSGAQYLETVLLIIPACLSCNTACSSCFGSSASQCYSCKPTYSLINGACTQCSTGCNTCNGTAANQCLTCSSGYWIRWDNTCITTCDSPTYAQTVIDSLQICGVPCPSPQFWLWNQTCGDCPAPLVQGVTNFGNYCYKPCDSGLYYAIWNSSCVSSCNSPFIILNIYGIDGCKLPCENNDFLYPDGSCSSQCDSPYKQRYDGLIWWCDYPCDFTNEEFLSFDGTCVSSCTSPSYQHTENNIVYCDACQPNYYRYPNDTCISDCTSPRLQRTVNNSMFCYNPCDFDNGESLQWDGICVSSCLSPSYQHTEDNIIYCDACQPGVYFRYPNDTCSLDCPSPWTQITVNNSYFCDYLCDFAGGESLSWDGTCKTSCNSPSYSRTENNIVYCDACQPGYDLYPNNTCLPGCLSPRIKKTINGSYFCNEPCDFSGGQFLSWDGSCVDSCSSPSYQRTEDNIAYCDVCQPEYYHYPNNTCLPDCDSPRLQASVNNSYFCNPPCDFDNGESLQWDGTCVSSCLSPSYQRTQDNIIYCDACQPGYFRYPNNTCQPDCSLPWQQKSINGSLFCSYPCQTSEFGYWNGSCFDSCDAPYQKVFDGSYQYCYPPCSASQFFYWDNSCQDSCDSPFKSTNTNGYKLCGPPCDDPNDFYYQNTSCLSICDTPYLQSTNNTVKYCNKPCSDSQFFFLNNNTCQDSCPSPLLQSKTNNVDTCVQPCSSTSAFFYPSDKTCRSNCDSPNIKSTQNSVKICIITPEDQLSDDEKKQVKNTNDAAQAGGAIAGAGASIAALVSSGNPGSALLVCFIKMLQYIKYMEIDYPPRLVYMFQMQNKTFISLNFIPSGPDPFENNLHKKPLPGKFDVYGGLDSHFLLNFWDSLWMIFIVAFITVLIIMLYIYFKRKGFPNAKNVFEQLTVIFKWNIMLILLCSTFDDIPLFTALELETLRIDSFSAFLSFSLCILMNIIAGYILFKIVYIVRDLRRTKRTKIFHSHTNVGKYIVESHRKWENCQVLYKAFKDDSFLQQIFLFVEMLRIFLFSLVIGLFYEFPIFQATLILSFSLIMLVLAAKFKPFEDKIDQIQQIVNELILLTVNICVFILAILDHQHENNTNIRGHLGDTIIACNLIFNFTAVIFFAIQLVIALQKMYKLIKSKKPKTLKAWFKMLLEVFQQDSMATDDKHTKNETTINNADALRGKFQNLFNTTEVNHHTNETIPIKSLMSPSKMNLLLTVEEDTSTLADHRNSFPISLLKVPSGLEPTSIMNLLPTPSPDKIVAENLKGHFSFRPSPVEFQEDVPSLNLLKNSSSSSKLASDEYSPKNANSVTSLVIPSGIGLKTPKNKGRKGLSSFRKSVNTIPEDLEKSQEKSEIFLQPPKTEEVTEGPFQMSFRKALMLRIISPRSPLPDIEEVRLENNNNNENVKLESEAPENSPNFNKDKVSLTVEGAEEELEKEKNLETEIKQQQQETEKEKRFEDYMELAFEKRESALKKIKNMAPPKINLDFVDDKQQKN